MATSIHKVIFLFTEVSTIACLLFRSSRVQIGVKCVLSANRESFSVFHPPEANIRGVFKAVITKICSQTFPGTKKS